MKKIAQSFGELEVYQAAFELQQAVYEASKSWPKEEKFALTDQVRRSSRSVGANLAEAWAKRRYPPHFLSKLTDSDGELQETLHWLDSALSCGYLGEVTYAQLSDLARVIGGKLGSMMARHESFCRVAGG